MVILEDRRRMALSKSRLPPCNDMLMHNPPALTSVQQSKSAHCIGVHPFYPPTPPTRSRSPNAPCKVTLSFSPQRHPRVRPHTHIPHIRLVGRDCTGPCRLVNKHVEALTCHCPAVLTPKGARSRLFSRVARQPGPNPVLATVTNHRQGIACVRALVACVGVV